MGFILNRLKIQAEKTITDEKAGFRTNKKTIADEQAGFRTNKKTITDEQAGFRTSKKTITDEQEVSEQIKRPSLMKGRFQ